MTSLCSNKRDINPTKPNVKIPTVLIDCWILSVSDKIHYQAVAARKHLLAMVVIITLQQFLPPISQW